MLRFLLFQFLKKLIHRILKLFVILTGFACVDELQQRGEVLLLLRGFIPDVANQCTVEQPFRLDPEIFARLLAITLCVGDDGIDQFQNIFLTADVMERIVSHGFFEVDGIQDFDLIPGIREHLSALDNNCAFGIGQDIAYLLGHLHQVGLDVKSGLTAAAAANHNDRAYFGCFGLPLIISRSVCVRMTLFSNTGSIKGSMSFWLPHRAEPYSSPCRYFFAFFPLK